MSLSQASINVGESVDKKNLRKDRRIKYFQIIRFFFFVKRGKNNTARDVKNEILKRAIRPRHIDRRVAGIGVDRRAFLCRRDQLFVLLLQQRGKDPSRCCSRARPTYTYFHHRMINRGRGTASSRRR